MSHPILPAGYNADPNNGDEVDGAGTNWPIWASLFDTFMGLVPLIVTEEMLKVFETTCSDVSFAWEINSVQFPNEQMLETISDDWGTVMIEGESTTLVFPWEPRTQAPRSDKVVRIAGQSDTLVLPDAADTEAIRKVG
jgi:hypothetical protein